MVKVFASVVRKALSRSVELSPGYLEQNPPTASLKRGIGLRKMKLGCYISCEGFSLKLKKKSINLGLYMSVCI